jgi:hypothetical protein
MEIPLLRSAKGDRSPDYVNDPINTLCALAGSLRGPDLLSEISLC